MPIAIERTMCGDKINGFLAKNVIHAADKPLLHPTTLILVVKPPRGEAQNISIILVNKAPKVLRLQKGETADLVYYDCLGGHLELEDVQDVINLDSADIDPNSGEIYLSPEMFLTAAKRELSEELVLQGDVPYGDKLFFLSRIEYGPAAMPEGGVNHEISSIYIYVLPEEIRDIHRDMIMRDDYLLGSEHIVCDFSVTAFAIDDLLEEYGLHPERFMDGIGRILKHWNNADTFSALLTNCLQSE